MPIESLPAQCCIAVQEPAHAMPQWSDSTVDAASAQCSSQLSIPHALAWLLACFCPSHASRPPQGRSPSWWQTYHFKLPTLPLMCQIAAEHSKLSSNAAEGVTTSSLGQQHVPHAAGGAMYYCGYDYGSPSARSKGGHYSGRARRCAVQAAV